MPVPIVYSGNGNVTLQLSWNVIPHVGRLPLVYSNTHQIQFPTQYTNSKQM